MKRIAEIAVEVAIALVIVVAIAVNAIYVPEDYWPEWLSFRVLGMAIFTFGYPLKWYRHYWKYPPFWGVFLALVTAHVVFFGLYFRTLGTLWLALISPVEWAIICPALDAVGKSAAGEHQSDTDR